MKKIIALALLLPALAHARFEEFVDFETPVPSTSTANVAMYVFGPMLVWLAIVWERGWKARALPIGVAAAACVCWAIWGTDGLSGAAIFAFVVALATGAWWATEKK